MKSPSLLIRNRSDAVEYIAPCLRLTVQQTRCDSAPGQSLAREMSIDGRRIQADKPTVINHRVHLHRLTIEVYFFAPLTPPAPRSPTPSAHTHLGARGRGGQTRRLRWGRGGSGRISLGWVGECHWDFGSRHKDSMTATWEKYFSCT